MLYQHGPHNGSNMGRPDALLSDVPGLSAERAAPLSEVLCRRLVSASVSVDNQTERVDCRDGVGQLLHDARREAGRRPRVQLARKTIGCYRGHPVVVLSYDYWANRFSRDPNVVGKKILVNNYPMTIVGVSAAGFAGLDPARSPQIRVPILMKPVIVPGVGLGSIGRPPDPLGAGVRAAEAGLHA